MAEAFCIWNGLNSSNPTIKTVTFPLFYSACLNRFLFTMSVYFDSGNVDLQGNSTRESKWNVVALLSCNFLVGPFQFIRTTHDVGSANFVYHAICVAVLDFTIPRSTTTNAVLSPKPQIESSLTSHLPLFMYSSTIRLSARVLSESMQSSKLSVPQLDYYQSNSPFLNSALCKVFPSFISPILLLSLALQPTMGFSLLSDFLPFRPFLTQFSPPSYSHRLDIFFNVP